MEVYKKINNAIKEIKKSDLVKAGRNDYSGYNYYTPDQVDTLVYNACKELDLFIKFDLVRNDLGISGKLLVIDIISGEKEIFEMASDIPSIKATNISQQLGGAMTYTKRYMLMNIFNIVDNNLDFDTPQKKITSALNQVNEWLSEQQLNIALKSGKAGIEATLKTYNNKGTKGMKKEFKTQLENKLKTL